MNLATILFVLIMSGLFYGIYYSGKKRGESSEKDKTSESYKKDVDDYLEKQNSTNVIIDKFDSYSLSERLSCKPIKDYKSSTALSTKTTKSWSN